MKKIAIIISIAAMFISSCSVIEKPTPADPTPVPPTPMPTATPDPCASENLLEEVEKMVDLINEFLDIVHVAESTQQIMMVSPILDMQAVRRNLQKLDVPDCEEATKTAALNYMDSTITYQIMFMGDVKLEREEVWRPMGQNSQILWQVVLGELNKLLASAGLVTEGLPDISNAVPQTTDSSFFVGNDGTQRVNVRSQPNLNAGVISRFEPGMQAIGLARNELGDWLQINLNGIIGWVYTEMVTTSAAVEELPISDPAQ